MGIWVELGKFVRNSEDGNKLLKQVFVCKRISLFKQKENAKWCRGTDLPSFFGQSGPLLLRLIQSFDPGMHACPSLDMWKYVCNFLPSKGGGREPSGVGGVGWLTLSRSRWLSCRRFPGWELEKGQTSWVGWTLRHQSKRKTLTNLGERPSGRETAPFALFSHWLTFSSIPQAFIEYHHI